MSVLMIAVSLVAIAVFHICRQRLKKYDAINNFPGPTSMELMRFMSNASQKDIWNYFIDLPKRYGPVVRLWVKPFRPALLVTDPKYFEQILMKREFLHKTDAYRLLSGLGSDGLLTNTNVDLWRKDRRMLAPCFNQKIIAQYPLVYQKHITKLVDKIKEQENGAVDVQPLLQRYTLGVIYEILTRENVNTNEDGVTTYLTSIQSFLSVYLERAFSSFKHNDFLYKFCKSYSTYIDSSKKIRSYVENIVNKQIIARNNTNHLEQESDFLGILLKSGVEYDKLIPQLITFVIGGSDTTAQVICFALYELAKKPEVQQKIYDEYITLVSMEKDYMASYEDILKLKYTEIFAKEAMRLYPSVPIIQRKLTTPVSIDGTVIPSDTDMIFSIIGLHNSSSAYENPHEFDADRFAPENSSKIKDGTYAPFSLGPRDCIGQRIAMAQVKFTISHIIRHFEVHPVVPEHKLDIVGQMALTSVNGIPVIFKERK